ARPPGAHGRGPAGVALGVLRGVEGRRDGPVAVHGQDAGLVRAARLAVTAPALEVEPLVDGRERDRLAGVEGPDAVGLAEPGRTLHAGAAVRLELGGVHGELLARVERHGRGPRTVHGQVAGRAPAGRRA